MINKQNLWFAMLFSIILVLSIFYVSMGEDTVKGFVNEDIATDDSSLVISESTELVSLRISSDEEVQNTMNELKNTLLSDVATVEEKNDAYNELLVLSNIKGEEEKLESILSKEFKVDSFVKINSNGITVVVDADKDSYEDANKIIRRIQEEYEDEKYITVKFN
jgi:stage III sporulation protein AH